MYPIPDADIIPEQTLIIPMYAILLSQTAAKKGTPNGNTPNKDDLEISKSRIVEYKSVSMGRLKMLLPAAVFISFIVNKFLSFLMCFS
jgi:hypothetical protein